MRERLHPFARAVNQALDRCGYPLCKGGVMAMNPQWCLSLPEWQAAFAQWIDRGDPESLLAASIFFDFRALWGHGDLALTLRAGIAAHAAANPRFLKQMSDNALRNRPPLSWRGEIAPSEDATGVDGIDLKRFGSMPITDGARIFALASGVVATNTQERLREAGARDGHRRGRPARAGATRSTTCSCCGCARSTGVPPASCRRPRMPNFVPLASLSSLDRRILKEALRQVRKLQQRLALDYP